MFGNRRAHTCPIDLVFFFPVISAVVVLDIFLDNGRIVLIPVLALKEDRAVMALTSMRVTTKYNHRPKSIIIRSAQAHIDK
jgi:hypothetical protein